ncbi:Structural maintenance of chromosomes protein, partial [Operophtera brumata]
MALTNNEIVVARTAFRDNSSHYTLGGRKVQFKEVSKVLRNYGIDLDHNRFLILQNPIEMISEKVEVLTESRKEKLNRVRAQTQGLQENKDRLQAKLIGLKRIVDEANKSFKLAESELKIYLSTEQKETDKLEKMKESYEKANKDLGEKKRSQLEESRQAMSANRSRGRVLDSLMKEKRNGNLPGIFGRLGDLGGIDLKYDVAVSTCCGALDNIVTDSVETAQACVEYLKRHDVGRATFIALDKQLHLKQAYERRQTLVLPAFYYALRDTLVASDLDQASRIAYGATRYRVVTLKGD